MSDGLWNWSKNNLTTDDVKKVEQILGETFPKDFVQCVLKNNGAYPELPNFIVNGQLEMLNNLLSLNLSDEGNILRMFELIQDRLPNKVIPFGRDAGGNMICFDYRKDKNNPTVVFWNHEVASQDVEKSIKFISNTFEEFLSMLHEADEE